MFVRMWTFKLVIFALIFCNNSVKGNKLTTQVACNGVTSVTLKMIFGYYGDQHFLTLIDGTDYHSLDSFVCVGGMEFLRPIDLYKKWTDVNFDKKIENSSVSSFSTVNGYFFRGYPEDLPEEFFEKISGYNPKARLLINVIGISVKESKDMIKMAYDKYGMLNVAAATFAPKYHNRVFVGFSIYFCMYNPYSGDATERRPEFKCWHVREDNINSVIIEMTEFQVARVKNLQGFPLTVTIFESEMRIMAVYDKTGDIKRFTYSDGEITSAIAKSMNFTPVYEVLPEGGPTYGFQAPDGKFFGSLAEVEYGRADLVANARLITNYNTTNSIFLQPITMTKLFFVVKRRGHSKEMMVTVFYELDVYSKACTLALTILMPVALIIIYKAETNCLGHAVKLDTIKWLLYFHGISNCVSMTHPKGTATRMIVTAILFSTLVMSSLFQGSIIKNLNLNKDIGKIGSIDQILEGNFDLGMMPELTCMFQGEGDDKVTVALRKLEEELLEIALPSEAAIYILMDDYKYAYLWTDVMSGNYLDNFYDVVSGENYFEVVPESAFEFYTAMMGPKSSPFIDRFNEIINVYVQSGLYQHETQQALNDNSRVWTFRVKNSFVPVKKNLSLTLYDMQNVFKLYLVFNVIGSIVFFIEVFIKFLTSH